MRLGFTLIALGCTATGIGLWSHGGAAATAGTLAAGLDNRSASTAAGAVQAHTMNTVQAAKQGSTNWAGYDVLARRGTYTSISGQWTVPNVTGSDNASAAQWIGLGGVRSKALLQIGTVETIQSGSVQAEIFWEKLPDVATPIMDVPVGATIAASIQQGTGGTWNLTVTEHDNGQSTTKTVPVTLSNQYAAAIGTSAEWISEDPTGQGDSLYPLADMGTVTYTNATANGAAIGATGLRVQQLTMIDNNGNAEVTTGSLSADGTSFSTQPATGTGSGDGYGYANGAGGTTGVSDGSGGAAAGGWPAGLDPWSQDGSGSSNGLDGSGGGNSGQVGLAQGGAALDWGGFPTPQQIEQEIRQLLHQQASGGQSSAQSETSWSGDGWSVVVVTH